MYYNYLDGTQQLVFQLCFYISSELYIAICIVSQGIMIPWCHEVLAYTQPNPLHMKISARTTMLQVSVREAHQKSPK